jgi:hypothetical protein
MKVRNYRKLLFTPPIPQTVGFVYWIGSSIVLKFQLAIVINVIGGQDNDPFFSSSDHISLPQSVHLLNLVEQ